MKLHQHNIILSVTVCITAGYFHEVQIFTNAGLLALAEIIMI